MPRHPEQTRRRLAQTGSRLRSLIHRETIAPARLQVSEPAGREGWGSAARARLIPAEIGDEFGPQWATFWFRIDASIPAEWAGERVDLIWDSGSEATLWRDGSVLQGLYSGWRALRTTAPIARPARGGESLELWVEMACNSWAGDDPDPGEGVDPALAARFRLGRNWVEPLPREAPRHIDPPARLRACALGLFDPLAWRLANDFDLLLRLEAERDGGLEADWDGELLAGLNLFCNTWSAGNRSSWEPADSILAALLDRRGPSPRHRARALGHAHVDTAWVWPIEETRRKLVRTAANQLGLLERYPGYRYAASSAQHYAWLEADDPGLFARVRERVAAGDWEVVGGSWVEPDCNLPAGESLIRQLLVGQRWFEDRFGRRCDVYWSPDTFGHNGQMPQILRQCGIARFLTQKLSWNQFTHPPHDSFRWRGIDGSEVLAHLPPVGSYNAELTPAELRAAVARFRDHDRCSESLVLFGHGDGGGGPTAEILERAARAGDLRGLPLVEQSTSAAFFAGLEAERERLGVIEGQLYFEYHRGTYTSQARTKRGNLAAERALQRAEAAAALARWRAGAEYPAAELAELWPLLLRNQFHDILPGTSLPLVHERAERELAEVVAGAEAVANRSLSAVAGGGAGNGGGDRGGSGAPFNPRGFDRREVIETPAGLALSESPPLGFGRLVEHDRDEEVTVVAAGATIRLANGTLTAELDRGGRLVSLRTAAAPGREALAGPGAAFSLEDDRPTAFDAWEVEPYGEQTRAPQPGAATFELIDGGPLRKEVVFVHRIGSGSAITQRVRLDAGSTRLEFRCRVDWHERNCMLRVAFPLAVRARQATYGAPFGVHELSTHRNTDADLAHFEAPALGFVDVGEHGFGVATLSSSNYGFAVDDATVSISLLRAPTDPDPEADQGEHDLAFAIEPHAGSWQAAGIARSALAFDQPPRWVEGAAPDDGFARVVGDGLILDTAKWSEDGEDLVLRLYEPHGASGTAWLRFADPPAAVRRANALEDSGEELALTAGAVQLDHGAFELITLRVRPPA